MLCRRRRRRGSRPLAHPGRRRSARPETRARARARPCGSTGRPTRRTVHEKSEDQGGGQWEGRRLAARGARDAHPPRPSVSPRVRRTRTLRGAQSAWRSQSRAPLAISPVSHPNSGSFVVHRIDVDRQADRRSATRSNRPRPQTTTFRFEVAKAAARRPTEPPPTYAARRTQRSGAFLNRRSREHA
jgi:hypothetical protein